MIETSRGRQGNAANGLYVSHGVPRPCLVIGNSVGTAIERSRYHSLTATSPTEESTILMGQMQRQTHILGHPLSPTTTRKDHSILYVSITLLLGESCLAHQMPFLLTQTGIMRFFLAGVLLLMLPFLALGFVPRLSKKGLAIKVNEALT